MPNLFFKQTSPGESPTKKEKNFSDRFSLAIHNLLNVFAVLGLFVIAFEPSLGEKSWFLLTKSSLEIPTYFIFLLFIITEFFRSKAIFGFFLKFYFDVIFFCPLFFFTYGGVHPTYILLVQRFFFIFNHYLQKKSFSNFAQTISERPARLISVSFLGVILAGTFLLVLPVSISPGNSPSFLTAMFTSTSAVCVTGLNVIDPGAYFSFFGQVVILALIQIGGLGIMTLSSIVALMLGKRMAISQQSLMENVLDQTDLAGLRKIAKDVFMWTIIIEFLGASVLTYQFSKTLPLDFLRAAYFGVFHSISAFCNAGFALFPNSFSSFASNPVVNFTIMGLIILGGLGFSVLGAVSSYLLGSRKSALDVHSTIVVLTTIFLIFAGATGVFFLELDSKAMANLSVPEKIMASTFQSVSTRTAGFNTIDIGSLRGSTLFLFVILMFIGASPCSTGGGIKTTTFAMVLLALDAQMKGNSEIVFMERTFPYELVLKAFLITSVSLVILGFFTFLLLLTEDQPFLKIFFEATSALATVGLSCNLTSELSSIGRVLVIALMYIGRIGPLTLALSFRAAPARGNICYPNAKILVG